MQNANTDAKRNDEGFSATNNKTDRIMKCMCQQKIKKK